MNNIFCGVKAGDCPILKQCKEKIPVPINTAGAMMMPGKCPFLDNLSPNAKIIPIGPDSSFMPLVVLKRLKCPSSGKAKTSGGVGTAAPKATPNDDDDDDELGSDLHESSSRELRAGILYHGCDCEKRNGLQDQCPRLQCHGSPRCLTIPPTCSPSKFSNAKHLTAKMKPRYQ